MLQRKTAEKIAERDTGAPTPEKAESEGPSNELMQGLLAEAATQADVGEDGGFLLSDDFELGVDGANDPGKFQFAEDGDDVGTSDTGVRKKQDADLPGLRPKHSGGNYEYMDYESGVAFVQGKGEANEVDANDPKQGALGNCYLIAGMIAVARANPNAIKDLIVDNGDGTFDVTLWIRSSRYARPKKVTTTIDAMLPSKYAGKPLYAKTGDQSEDGDTELWPALIEKAVAQQKGSYDMISGGNIGKDGFTFAGTTELLTGKVESYYALSKLDEDDALLYIAIALDDNQAVSCDTKNFHDDPEVSKKANVYNVYGNHAYCPSSVDLDSRKINLQNPWGSSHVVELPVDKFLEWYRSIRIGG